MRKPANFEKTCEFRIAKNTRSLCGKFKKASKIGTVLGQKKRMNFENKNHHENKTKNQLVKKDQRGKDGRGQNELVLRGSRGMQRPPECREAGRALRCFLCRGTPECWEEGESCDAVMTRGDSAGMPGSRASAAWFSWPAGGPVVIVITGRCRSSTPPAGATTLAGCALAVLPAGGGVWTFEFGLAIRIFPAALGEGRVPGKPLGRV